MRSSNTGHSRSLGSVVVSFLAVLSACGAPSDAPQSDDAQPVVAQQALTVTLWSEGVETTPPAPLTANEVTNIFEYVNGASSTAGTNFVGRISGTVAAGNVHGGSFGLLFRAQATQAPASGVPTYNYEVRKRINTSTYTHPRLTFWRRLVGFESTLVNGQTTTDRFVVRYSTAVNPGPTDWTEALVSSTVNLGTWGQDTVENLPVASTLWISFLADFKARLNTAVTPNVYQFDEWTYVDDFVVTGEFGCSTNAECGDGNLCTSDVCDVATGVCSNPVIACNDGNACTTDACNPATGVCGFAAVTCNDGDACTTDSCNPGTGACTTTVKCEDNDVCTADSCDAQTGACIHTNFSCDDFDPCTADSCDPQAASPCQHGAVICNDGNACTSDYCDGATGACNAVPIVCDDGNACTSDACNPANGSCTTTPVSCGDGLYCNGAETCTSASGCGAGTAPSADDGIACTLDACDEAGDQVTHVPSDALCDDQNECTADVCSAASGCSHDALTGAACAGGHCNAQSVCVPDPVGPCANVPEHTPCGTGASWCEDGACVLSDACGDGWLNRSGVNEPVETCDDGNNLSGDACSPECESEIITLVPSGLADFGDGTRVYAADDDGDGRMLVVWQTADGRLLARRMTATGLVNQGDATPIQLEATLAPGLHAEPEVVGLPDGGWVILYTLDVGPFGATRIVQRRMEANGSVNAASVLDASSRSRNDFRVRAVAVEGGLVPVVWFERVRGAGQEVHVRLGYLNFQGGVTSGALLSIFSEPTSSVPAELTIAATGYRSYSLAWTTGTAPLQPSSELRRYDYAEPIGTHRGVVAVDARSPMLEGGRLVWVSTTTQRVMTEPSLVATPGTGFLPESNPQQVAFGAGKTLIAYGYGSAGDIDVSVRDEQAMTFAAPADADLIAALRGPDSQRDLELESAQNGAWFFWREGGQALRASLLGRPDYAREDAPLCFNHVQREDYGGLLDWYPDTLFGTAVAASGDHAVVGGPTVMPAGGELAGAATIYGYDGANWSAEASLVGSNPYHLYGRYVAIDHDIVAVGTYLPVVDDDEDGRGGPTVYQQIGDEWREADVYPTDPSNPIAGDLDLADQQWLFVSEANGSSRTEIYRRVPGVPADSWHHSQIIELSANVMHTAAAVTEETALIAVQRFDWTRTIYVLQRLGDTWLQTGTIALPDGSDGSSWSIKADGELALFIDSDQDPIHVLSGTGGAWHLTDIEIPLEPNEYYPSAAITPEYVFIATNRYLYSYARSGDSLTLIKRSPSLRNSQTWSADTLAYASGTIIAGEPVGRIRPDRTGIASFASCQPALACGDGWLEAGEECDDGNAIAGDGCEPTCTVTPPCVPTSSIDTTCNNLDEDCDELVDDDFPGQSTACGVGACSTAGSTSCVNGLVIDSCMPLAPLSSNDASCNNVDDDCDGPRDENFPSASTSCGLGVCARAGATSCVSGAVVDSCAPGAPLSSTDATCNDLDDDCDGARDDNYVSQATSCGVGVCARTGTTGCVVGVVFDSCVAGAPLSSTDATCDDVDDDCDGTRDDNYASQATSCGVGACARTGATSCVNGAVVDSCAPAVAAPDTSCNNVDEDCDAHIDESYVPSATSCGVGACVRSGSTSCANGTVSNSCTPGAPITTDDTTCDGIDDNCNGQLDENCTCVQQTAALSAHVSAGRAFLCSTTATTFFADGFESNTLSGWTTTGTFTTSNATAQSGTYSAQAAGPGTSTLSRTFNTLGLSTATLAFNARTRGPNTSGYGINIRRSTNGGSTWTTVASAPGPFSTWNTASFPNMPISSSLLISFEAAPTDATRFVHYDNITITGTCTTPTYFSTGAQANLGSGASTSATLYNLTSEPGFWRSGSCPVCGNGITQPGETCDDGNRVTELCPGSACQVCNSNCQLVAGAIDACPSDPDKTAPGICGCGVADTDSDADGTANCNDLCPNNAPKVVPGVCGCAIADTDSDGDGTPNCNDACASDPLKIALGVCGCGEVDADADNDQVCDRDDTCLSGPNDDDADSDGVPDACDYCAGRDDYRDLDSDGVIDDCDFLTLATQLWGLSAWSHSAAFDLDHDSRIDLVGGSRVALNQGDFTFETGFQSGCGAGARTTDFDGDGFIDSIYTDSVSRTYVCYGTATTAGTQHTLIASSVFDPVVAVGNVTGDGAADAAIADYNSLRIVELSLPSTRGVRSVQTIPLPTPGQGVRNIEIADFNRDGSPEIFVERDHQLVILERHSGSDYVAVTLTATQGEHSEVGDIDGDGLLDLVLATSADGPSAALRVHWGLPATSISAALSGEHFAFAAASTLSTPSIAVGTAIARIEADQIGGGDAEELVVRMGAETVVFGYDKATNSLLALERLPSPLALEASIVADLDSNGKRDLVLPASSERLDIYANRSCSVGDADSDSDTVPDDCDHCEGADDRIDDDDDYIPDACDDAVPAACTPGMTGPGIFDGDAIVAPGSGNAAIEDLSGIYCVTGDLTIVDTSLTSLSALSSLESVAGSLTIAGNGALTQVDDLESLVRVDGGLYIRDNGALTNLEGLSQLTTLGAHLPYNEATLSIFDNTSLPGCWVWMIEDVTRHACTGTDASDPSVCRGNVGAGSCGELPPGFECVPGATGPGVYDGTVQVSDSFEIPIGLEEMTGVRCVTGGIYISNYTGAEDLSALSGLRMVGYDLHVRDSSVSSLHGLEALTSVGRRFHIVGNPRITDLHVLDNFDTLGPITGNEAWYPFLSISGNASLPGCWAWALADRLDVECPADYCRGNTGVGSCGSLPPGFVCEPGASGAAVFDGDVTLEGGYGGHDLSGVECITGDVTVLSNGYYDLVPTPSLRAIGGSLTVEHSTLTTLDGLNQLESIGEVLTIADNENLESLAALRNLTSLGERLPPGHGSALHIQDHWLLPGCWGWMLEEQTGQTNIRADGSPERVHNYGYGSCGELPPDFECVPGATGPGVIDGSFYRDIADPGAVLELGGVQCITGTLWLEGIPEYYNTPTTYYFAGLKSVGTLAIVDTDYQELDGFSDLREVRERLYIDGNDWLFFYSGQSYPFFANLRHVGEHNASALPSLSIVDNATLPACWVSALEEVTGTVCQSPVSPFSAGCTGNTGTAACLPVRGPCDFDNGGCDAATACVDDDGAVSCGECPAGYAGTGEPGCIDIDECALGLSGCDAAASCTNYAGGFACVCPVGTLDVRGDGTECVAAEQVAAGNTVTCAITVGGELYCWGSNLWHILGPSSSDQSRPVRIGSAHDWQAVAVGASHACAIRDGAMYCWGSNSQGQLGNLTYEMESAPRRVGDQRGWQSVSAGDGATCGLRNGRLYCWGANYEGQFADGTIGGQAFPAPTGAATWTTVVTSGRHSCGIRAGELYCWGTNGSGQLGNDTTLSSTIPIRVGVATDWERVAVGGADTCAIRASRLYCWGANLYGQLGVSADAGRRVPTQVGEGIGWQAVTVSGTRTCGIQDGHAFCWGQSILGDGTTESRATPTQIGTSNGWQALSAGTTHTCGVLDGEATCWGQDYYGELGYGALEFIEAPSQVGSATDWSSIALGDDHSCGVRSGELYCWGTNNDGQLGDGTLIARETPRRVGSDQDWMGLSAGAGDTTCGLRAPGALYCWGDGGDHVLARSVETRSVVPLQIGSAVDWSRVSVGNSHVCGIRSGALYCWGRNNQGQQGNGVASSVDVQTPTQVGLATDWQDVDAGDSYTCGIRSGTLYCWGINSNAQLGDGTNLRRLVPTQIGLATDWGSVNVGAGASCGIRSGALYCWGGNLEGPLQVGNATDWQQTSVGAQWAGVRGGVAHWWGASFSSPGTGGGTFAPAPVPLDGLGWQMIHSGGGHACAIRAGGLYCWGDNQSGQVGVSPSWRPVPISF